MFSVLPSALYSLFQRLGLDSFDNHSKALNYKTVHVCYTIWHRTWSTTRLNYCLSKMRVNISMYSDRVQFRIIHINCQSNDEILQDPVRFNRSETNIKRPTSCKILGFLDSICGLCWGCAVWKSHCFRQHFWLFFGWIFFLRREYIIIGPKFVSAWWRHQMEIFSALLAMCTGNSPVTGEFPAKDQWRGALMFSAPE